MRLVAALAPVLAVAHGYRVTVVSEVPVDMTDADMAQALKDMSDIAESFFAADEFDLNNWFKASARDVFDMQKSAVRGKGHLNRVEKGPLSCACSRDLKAFCADLATDAHKQPVAKLTECLMGHLQDISLECYVQLENKRVLTHCKDDIPTFCSEVTPGHQHLHTCLLGHQDELQTSCKAYFLKRKEEHEVLENRKISRLPYDFDKTKASSVPAHVSFAHKVHHTMSKAVHHIKKQPVHVHLGVTFAVIGLLGFAIWGIWRWRGLPKSKKDDDEEEVEDEAVELNPLSYRLL